MNKLFAHTLSTIIYTYLQERQKGLENDSAYDETLMKRCENHIIEAEHYGLVKWVNKLPVVNMAKMTGGV